MIPTSKSETARLEIIIIEGVRMEGVFKMAARTKEFPVIDMRISGTLSTKFTMTIISWLLTAFLPWSV